MSEDDGAGMRSPEIRRLSVEDWVLFRRVRLEALAEAPEAFASTLEREQVKEVIAWAAEGGHPKVELWVADGNAQAERLYSRTGFLMTDETQPHPNDPDVNERLMVRLLKAESSSAAPSPDLPAR